MSTLEEHFRVSFRENSDCYADSEEVIQAMSEDRFIWLLRFLGILET